MSAGAILRQFSHDFGVPFLLGHKCVIGDPLGREGLAAIRHGLSIDAELVDAIQAQFLEAALLADVTPAPFDHDAATLMYAAHELFATSHPQATSFYARAHLFCKAAAHEVNALPRSLEPGRLLTRHLIVRRAFGCTRTDVHVKWWTGRADFYGTDVPRRLVQWPTVRRVHVDKQTQPMWKIALAGGDEETRVSRVSLMTALLDASPLSRMLFVGDALQKALGFSLLLPTRIGGRKASPLDVLEDRRIARFVTDAILQEGFDVGGPTLALALLQGLREGAPPMVLRRAAEFCTHLALTACLIEGESPDARESAPLRAFIDDDQAKLNEASRVFWAVVSATLTLGKDGTLLVPALSLFPERARLVAERLKQRVQHKRVVAVAEPLARELRRRLPVRGKGEAPGLPSSDDEARP